MPPTATPGSIFPRTCRRCGIAKHQSEYYRSSASADGWATACKPCYNTVRTTRGPGPRATVDVTADDQPPSQDAPAARSATKVDPHAYVADPKLVRIFQATLATRTEQEHALTLMFLGPSGCGKTKGAEYLAASSNLPFTKVDAAAMTDPESWFGTREVEAKDGVSVTTYRPSAFVEAITRPGVLLIDEVNRVRDEHRNILLPLFDGTHRVTNPLTGEQVIKHPECQVIMSGNRGLNFTGTYAVDPALMTRSIVVEFDYLSAKDEIRAARAQTGAAEHVANAFVKFAADSRKLAKANPDVVPISTREVVAACRLVVAGLSADEAAEVAIMNGASDEGGAESVRQQLRNIWGGIRVTAQG